MRSFVAAFQGGDAHDPNLVMSSTHQSILFSVPLVGTIVGAVASTYLQQRLGRKRTLLYAYLFSIPAVVLQLVAPNLGAFVAGRFWNALSYGTATCVAPLFLSDIVPARIRGQIVSSANIFTITAQLLASVICYASETTHRYDHWSYSIPLAVQVALPVALFFLTLFVTESPIWLVSKGRYDDARAILRKLRSSSDATVDSEIELIRTTEDNARTMVADVRFWDIFKPTHLQRTLVAGSLFSLNQISGIILSTTYATVFLVQLGVGNPFALTIIGASCQLLGAFGAPLILDRVGRRPVAMAGFSALLVIDIIAGALAFRAGSDMQYAKAVAALSFIFNFVWTLSFYSLSLVMPAEVPTAKLRNATMSYAIGWGQTTAVITTFAVPQLTGADAANLGAKTYLVFGGCMAVILVVFAFYLPETKGRTPAEIDEMYDDKVKAWRWRDHVTRTGAKDATLGHSTSVQPTLTDAEKL